MVRLVAAVRAGVIRLRRGFGAKTRAFFRGPSTGYGAHPAYGRKSGNSVGSSGPAIYSRWLSSSPRPAFLEEVLRPFFRRCVFRQSMTRREASSK